MDNDLKEVPLPMGVHIPGFWAFYRRPVLLVTGTVVFLVWLPIAPRAALFAALLAQRVRMSLLFLFALIALSLAWSAGPASGYLVDPYGLRLRFLRSDA